MAVKPCMELISIKKKEKKMKQGKAGEPSWVIVEMIKAGGRETNAAISELVNLNHIWRQHPRGLEGLLHYKVL